MSVIHVRHIKSALEKAFTDLIDLSDVTGQAAAQRESVFLTRSLAAFCLAQVLELDHKAAAHSVVDGFDDNGIDAIHYHQADRVLYVVQSKWISKGTGSPPRGEIQKFIQGFRDLLDFRLDRFNSKVQAKKEDLRLALDDAQVRFVLLLGYTGQDDLGQHAKRDLDDLLLELNDPTVVVSIRVLNQEALHRAVSTQASGGAINLEVMLHEWGQITAPYLAYYGQVDAADVAGWWTTHGTALLAKNLRNFTGSTEVNDGIVQTLTLNPEKFFYFNNGVTVLCSSLSKKAIGGSKRSTGVFVCGGVSVVNGAQTVGSVATAFSRNPDRVQRARVSVRFISLGNCPEGFATEVTRATNTQNRIERRDFAALDPQQERLRTELWLDGKYYVYRSGDPTPTPDAGCTIDEAAVALACSNPDVGLCVQAKREVGKLYEDIEKAPYKQLFNANLSSLRLWRSVEMMRIVETALKEGQSKMDGKNRMVAIHGNRLILHEAFRRLKSDLDDPNLEVEKAKAQVKAATGDILTRLCQAVADTYPGSYLHSLFKNASKTKELARKILK